MTDAASASATPDLPAPKWIGSELARGFTAHQAGRLAEATECYEHVLAHVPDEPHALRLLGEIAQRTGNPERAIELTRRSLACNPDSPEAHNNIGVALKTIGRIEEAAQSFRQALRLKPDFRLAHRHLADILLASGQHDDAILHFAAAAGLDGTDAEAITKLGGAFMNADRVEEAYCAFARAAVLNPTFSYAHQNLGMILVERGDLPAAIGAFRCALSLAPQNVAIYAALAGALFRLERFGEAWDAYEQMWQIPENRRYRERHGLKLWSGEALTGRRLLLWGEQGIGDVVLFSTMLPDLLATGADIVLEVDARLVPLFSRSFPQVAVIASGASLPSCDFQANIGRLGHVLRTSTAAFTDSAPYLVPDPARVTSFRQRYSAIAAGPKIGISWRSKSDAYRRKSLSLDAFEPLFSVFPEAVFVSLQYGDTADERAAFEQRFGAKIVHDDSFDNWTDLDGLAAQIAALDHVVTVSNLNAHFAGAQGKPAHVLTMTHTLWYWPQGKTTTPWYPSITLHPIVSGRPEATVAAIASSLRP